MDRPVWYRLSRLMWVAAAVMLVVGVILDSPVLLFGFLVVMIATVCMAGAAASIRLYRQQHPPR